MGFPFLAPLSPWITEVLKQREENTFDTAFRNPYAILTSAALVVKGTAETDPKKRKEQLDGLINKPPNDSYKGCIISNNANDIGLSYQTGKTIIGIDFTGKPIEVEGETGRKVSTPIIESIEIDTDGANNTLKTARINMICFTLKQLEMFELFFMKPGIKRRLRLDDQPLAPISPDGQRQEARQHAAHELDGNAGYGDENVTVEKIAIPVRRRRHDKSGGESVKPEAGGAG